MNRAVSLILVALDLRAAVRAGTFHLRQGLWIEDYKSRQGRNAATVV